MEVQDLPRIAEIAHRHGALVGCDNTWATPLCYKPIDHGADLVTEALTKYFNGHSDLLMGSITVARDDLIAPIRGALGRYGIGVSPDDATLVLRGMETMGLRMQHAARVAQALIGRFQGHEAVDRVLYPALPSSPDHALWKRDFLGASGVFSVVFRPEANAHVEPALNLLETFAIGASWGGTRSLVAPMPVRRNRTARPWTGDDLILRISIGVEAPDDLDADIGRFLDEIAARLGADRARRSA
jgi:cystathionine beta-lyase